MPPPFNFRLKAEATKHLWQSLQTPPTTVPAAAWTVA